MTYNLNRTKILTNIMQRIVPKTKMRLKHSPSPKYKYLRPYKRLARKLEALCRAI